MAACVTVAYSDATLLAGAITASMRQMQKIKNMVCTGMSVKLPATLSGKYAYSFTLRLFVIASFRIKRGFILPSYSNAVVGQKRAVAGCPPLQTAYVSLTNVYIYNATYDWRFHPTLAVRVNRCFDHHPNNTG